MNAGPVPARAIATRRRLRERPWCDDDQVGDQSTFDRSRDAFVTKRYFLYREGFNDVHEPASAKELAHSSAVVVRGAGQQPTKGECATNRKRARDRAKTYLLSCKSSLLCANYLAVMVLFRGRKLAVFRTGSGGPRPPRAMSAACRGHGGARSAPRRLRPHAAVKIVGQSHSLCYLCSSRGSIGERHDQSTSSFAAHRPRPRASKDARLTPALREPRFADCSPVKGGCEKEPAFCSNPLKALKTAMGRPCNKLA